MKIDLMVNIYIDIVHIVCERGGFIKREGHRHVSKRDEARVEEIVIQGLHACNPNALILGHDGFCFI
jgi:hypothetical protein